MPVKKTIMLLLICSMLPVFSFADMCSWVDKDGIRHFSNTNDCPNGEGTISPEAADGDAYADQNRVGLRFMGVYREGINYLRFYGDGTVVSAASSGRPEQLTAWFGKSAKHAYKGRYRVDGKAVKFYTLYKQKNIVLAKGIAKGNVLAVSFLHMVEKHLNERNFVQKGIRIYKFIPMDFPRENRY